MDRVDVARALSSSVRLHILELLKDPEGNFTSQREGDLSGAGACVSVIARELGFSQPTVSRHLEILRDAGLVETERVAQWNFHRRDHAGIRRARDLLSDI